MSILNKFISETTSLYKRSRYENGETTSFAIQTPYGETQVQQQNHCPPVALYGKKKKIVQNKREGLMY